MKIEKSGSATATQTVTRYKGDGSPYQELEQVEVPEIVSIIFDIDEYDMVVHKGKLQLTISGETMLELLERY